MQTKLEHVRNAAYGLNSLQALGKCKHPFRAPGDCPLYHAHAQRHCYRQRTVVPVSNSSHDPAVRLLDASLGDWYEKKLGGLGPECWKLIP